ncbi:MAG: Glu-tRNA(Gln) amidotransferase subunit GatE, partial [Methanolinea sp.]|nr:Glu-tRNA(Gln) amidotransferase subunit GatE [Methanolinea sp.]
VENDEEPPAPLNDEALSAVLLIAKMFGMTPVPHIHVMRKLVIDGSNTSGFQRTALAAVDGSLPNGGSIETICLEEEAAQRVEGEVFSLDRLGIPLVEITTSPCMHTPGEVQEMAEYLGMVLRSTGMVKRGLGTIRQDINISIRDGARVEIKGVQELDLIAEVVKREVQRQQNLLALREELKRRNATVPGRAVDVTSVFSRTASGILKKAPCILAVLLPGFSGLLGRDIQPGRRLGSELSDYAKKCGVGGLFHTDELPAYGITADEVTELRGAVEAKTGDGVVIVSGTREKAECAVRQVIMRAQAAFAGIPEETRKMLEGGSTAYMRPLPGAARMYPETDVLPVTVDPSRWEGIVIPELLKAKADRFVKAYDLDPAVARQLAFSSDPVLFERLVQAGIPATLAARTLTATLKELSREGLDTSALTEVGGDILQSTRSPGSPPVWKVLSDVNEGKIAKEAIPEVFRAILQGSAPDDAVARFSSDLSADDLRALIRKIVDERIPFIRDRGPGALGPLMGVVMKEVRGSVDGKLVSETLRTEIQRVLNL